MKKTFKTIMKEYARSDDFYDLSAMLFSGNAVIAIVFDNGDIEYTDEEYYKEEGREALVKKRGKQVAKVFKITSETIL